MALDNLVDPKTGELKRKIRFGLPKGSLNSPRSNRGYTRELFRLAEYDIKGYESWEEKDKPVVEGLEDHFEFYTAKPNVFPELLGSGGLDLAIFGLDTFIENECERNFCFENIRGKKGHDSSLTKKEQDKLFYSNPRDKRFAKNFNNFLSLLIGKKICPGKIVQSIMTTKPREVYKYIPLGYGRTDVCIGSIENLRDRLEKEIYCGFSVASAFPFITLDMFNKYFPEKEICIQGRLEGNWMKGDKIRIKPIRTSNEMMIELGLASIIVDIVSSGKSFEAHRIKKMGKPLISNSTAGIHTSVEFGAYFPQGFYSQDGKFNPPKSFNQTQLSNDICGACDRFLENPKMTLELQRILNPFLSRLEEASHKYGETREDSIYHPKWKNHRQI